MGIVEDIKRQLIVSGQAGRFTAALAKNPLIAGTGRSSKEAIYSFLIEAAARGLSGKEENYTVVINHG